MPELIGTDVLYRRWEVAPAGAPAKGLFLLVHGLGANTGRWSPLADGLARGGFISYGIELRGFGRTPERPRGHVDSLRIWESDVLKLRETIIGKHPGKKIFLLGESVGGLVAFNLACRYPAAFDGQVLLSPDFKNGLKFPISSYLTLSALLLFRPRKTLTVPFTSAMCTRDASYQAVMDANPDELRIASLRCLTSILSEQRAARKLARSLRMPSLFLLAGQDFLVDERAGRRLFARLALPDKRLIEYPDMLHALSIDMGRENVIDDILAWTGPRV